MTPLEQTFWCQQYNQYMSGFLAVTKIVEHATASDTCAKLADLDLAEFRKRFGEGLKLSPRPTDAEVTTAMQIATGIIGRNNQTAATTLYPWELLPEWVKVCATDGDGNRYGYPSVPDMFEEKNCWSHPSGEWICLSKIYDSYPNWRLSLEKRPGGGR